MNEIGHLGETNETLTLREMDRSSDGVVSMTRQQSAEQEMLRDGMSFHAELLPRHSLLNIAAKAKPVLREWSVTPLDDRILVKMASFYEGYVCETCKGDGHSETVCDFCGGKKQWSKTTNTVCIACDGAGHIPGLPADCRRCEGTGSLEVEEKVDCAACRVVGAKKKEPWSCGHVPCGTCKGTGLREGVIAVPDESQQDHSYGDIMVCGLQIQDLAPGDRVLFSKMAGIYIRGNDGGYILMRRGEVMGLMTR